MVNLTNFGAKKISQNITEENYKTLTVVTFSPKEISKTSLEILTTTYLCPQHDFCMIIDSVSGLPSQAMCKFADTAPSIPSQLYISFDNVIRSI